MDREREAFRYSKLQRERIWAAGKQQRAAFSDVQHWAALPEVLWDISESDLERK